MMITEKIIESADGKQLPFSNYRYFTPGNIHDNGTLDIELAYKFTGDRYHRLKYEEIKEFIKSDLSTITMYTMMETAPNGQGYYANRDKRKIGEFHGFTKDPVVMNSEGPEVFYRLILRQEKVADEKAAADMNDINALYEGITEVYEGLLG